MGLGTRAILLAQYGFRGEQVQTKLKAADLANTDKERQIQSLIQEREQNHKRLLKLEAEIQQLKKHFLGPKSEKIPTPEAELRKADGDRADPAETRRKRMENALARSAMPSVRIVHSVPVASRMCPSCAHSMTPVELVPCAPIIEYALNGFIHQEHVLERLVCSTCKFSATAAEPARVLEGGRYGSGFMAYLAVAKCGDSIPIYRLEKSFRRLGVPMARSSMNELLHATARELEPIYKRLMEHIRSARIVRADETSMRVQKRKKRGFVWTFISSTDEDAAEPGLLIGYRFSADRSGETPRDLLGGTSGYLLVDGYSGYNVVVDVHGRVRVCCNAHARRRFHEALGTAPVEARRALDFYLEAYRVEREAKLRGIVGTEAHLKLRQTRSRKTMDEFKAWLEVEKPRHLPKGPMGSAISYALNHWTELTRFLDDAVLAIDNNASESALRVVALGRKNFLHFGHDQAGQNIAMLYSLVSTCEANNINPIEYLRDVLLRLRTHPHSRLDELLPHLWRPAEGDGSDPEPSDPGGAPAAPDEEHSPATGEAFEETATTEADVDAVASPKGLSPQFELSESPASCDCTQLASAPDFSASVAEQAQFPVTQQGTATARAIGGMIVPNRALPRLDVMVSGMPSDLPCCDGASDRWSMQHLISARFARWTRTRKIAKSSLIRSPAYYRARDGPCQVILSANCMNKKQYTILAW